MARNTFSVVLTREAQTLVNLTSTHSLEDAKSYTVQARGGEVHVKSVVDADPDPTYGAITQSENHMVVYPAGRAASAGDASQLPTIKQLDGANIWVWTPEARAVLALEEVG